jgi:hypothetical protein
MTYTDEDVREHVCIICGETKPEGYTLTAGWYCADCVQRFADEYDEFEEDEYEEEEV